MYVAPDGKKNVRKLMKERIELLLEKKGITDYTERDLLAEIIIEEVKAEG